MGIRSDSYSKAPAMDKVALVTGSSRGIGKAIAEALARNGLIVVIHYLNSEKEAKDTLDEVKKFSPRSTMVKADIREPSQVHSLLERILGLYGRIDYLVNNAGATYDTLFKNMGIEAWDAVINTNLRGTFLVTKECYQHICSAKGRILNIASISGEAGNIGQANYSAAKAGIIGFTKSLAKEAAREGVTVNAISPGLIGTDMVKTIPAKVYERIVGSIPLQRIGRPEEVAELAVFLLLNKGNYITGQTIRIDGGMYI